MTLLLDQPYDILFEIFLWPDRQSLIRCRQVCTTFFNVVTYDVHLWKRRILGHILHDSSDFLKTMYLKTVAISWPPSYRTCLSLAHIEGEIHPLVRRLELLFPNNNSPIEVINQLNAEGVPVEMDALNVGDHVMLALLALQEDNPYPIEHGIVIPGEGNLFVGSLLLFNK